MTVELITGHAGSAHISAADDGWQNVGIFGNGKYVLDTGTQFAAEVQNANLVTIGVGDAMFEGRHVRVSATENVAIDNGAQGMNRNDIICIKYEYDSGTDVESASLAVVKGTASSTTPSDPTIPSGSILDSDSTAYMPLWRVPIEGITVNTPVKLYGDVVVTLEGMLTKTWTASQIPNIQATKITSGTLNVLRIPNLDASKITSGTFDAGRIPNLAASKITSGTFSSDRIPSLDASKITSGTLGADRIPNISAAKITSGTLPISRGGTNATTAAAALQNIMGGKTVLYNSSGGTNSTVTLSSSAANFNHMRIYYYGKSAAASAYTRYCSVDVYSPNGKMVSLSCVGTQSASIDSVTLHTKNVTISGTSITSTRYFSASITTTGTNAAESNEIYITRVEGWNE